MKRQVGRICDKHRIFSKRLRMDFRRISIGANPQPAQGGENSFMALVLLRDNFRKAIIELLETMPSYGDKFTPSDFPYDS